MRRRARVRVGKDKAILPIAHTYPATDSTLRTQFKEAGQTLPPKACIFLWISDSVVKRLMSKAVAIIAYVCVLGGLSL